jgi:hypothetical protein
MAILSVSFMWRRKPCEWLHIGILGMSLIMVLRMLLEGSFIALVIEIC